MLESTRGLTQLKPLIHTEGQLISLIVAGSFRAAVYASPANLRQVLLSSKPSTDSTSMPPLVNKVTTQNLEK
jgi:hypothetical protein